MAKGELAPGKKQIVCVIDEALVNEIDKYAERFGASRSRMVARFVEEGIDHMRFYDRFLFKPEKAWNFAAFMDRFAMRFGLPAPFGTDGKWASEFVEEKRKKLATKEQDG